MNFTLKFLTKVRLESLVADVSDIETCRLITLNLNPWTGFYMLLRLVTGPFERTLE